MPIDPKLLKQLIATFKTELDEQVQSMTTGLLNLEKGNINQADQKNIIATIFRCAHNIKGTSRSLGILTIGEIAHRIESLFSLIQKNNIKISHDLINLCFEATDKMQSALSSFIDEVPLAFDIDDLLARLDNNSTAKINIEQAVTIDKPVKKIKESQTNTEYETIRIAISKIDKLSSFIEDIQVNRIAIDDYSHELNLITKKSDEFYRVWRQLFLAIKNHGDNININETIKRMMETANDNVIDINDRIRSASNNMDIQINELSLLANALQEEIKLLRLIPADNLLCTLPRYVRDLAQELNKNVELTISGGDVKIDKIVLEGLKNPIIHLLRNAIDHGIETSEVRKKIGKPEVGKISIDIKEEGSQIYIYISDDGAGIDANKIRNEIEKKSLVTPAELNLMNEDQIIETIFNSGFSTKTIITDVSGRGVGLDVVKSNIVNLKGQVNVKTEVGKGTTFSLRVPLMLLSERGLLVRVADQKFVIPVSSVERVCVVNQADIVNVEGCHAILLDGHTIRLEALYALLKLGKTHLSSEDKISVVIIKNDLQLIALLVDEIMGEREIVIKPLSDPITKVRCVAGGTLLESNQVIIVLNPNDVIKMMLHPDSNSRLEFQEKTTEVIKKPHILVVDDSITTRTLEKNVLESKNYQVTVAVNGKEAWDLLQKQQFSLLITDVMMPIMDGFTLTENVKKSDQLRHMPVIIVTSLGSDVEKKRGIDVGADAYIVKNEFESGVLLDVVSQLI